MTENVSVITIRAQFPIIYKFSHVFFSTDLPTVSLITGKEKIHQNTTFL